MIVMHSSSKIKTSENMEVQRKVIATIIPGLSVNVKKRTGQTLSDTSIN